MCSREVLRLVKYLDRLFLFWTYLAPTGFDISDAQFSHLESRYGRKIPSAARHYLLQICSDHLLCRYIATQGVKIEEVLAELRQLRELLDNASSVTWRKIISK